MTITMDPGTATTSATLGTDLGDNPLFRSFLPKAVPYRHLPRLARVALLEGGCEMTPQRLAELKRLAWEEEKG